MYGVEAQTSGGAGLAAQVPYGDLYFASALNMSDPEVVGLVGAPAAQGSPLPDVGIGRIVAPIAAPQAVGADGTAATVGPSEMQTNWKSVLDFHNSPAPWILIGLLAIVGWLQASASASGRVGPARAAASLGI